MKNKKNKNSPITKTSSKALSKSKSTSKNVPIVGVEEKKVNKAIVNDKHLTENIIGNDYDNNYFNYKKNIYGLALFKKILIIILVVSVVTSIFKVFHGLNEQNSFHAVSKKLNKDISDKDEAINSAFEIIKNVNDSNDAFSSTNLNLSKVYGNIVDPEERADKQILKNLPVPVTMDEDVENDDDSSKSIAFKIFSKLQNRYEIYNTSLYNLSGMNPVQIVRQYHYDGYSIIGKYNPEDSTHIKGKRHTYFIPNFTNCNINYYDGDGNPIIDDSNIKDIMSMASVYTYYHDPYDTNTFLKQCYDLFDNSYSYVASISEVYYCSGCMNYVDSDLSVDTNNNSDITVEKIPATHELQKVFDKEVPYKQGTLKKMKEDTYNVNNYDYNTYVDDVKSGNLPTDKINNYCPGHIDLNIDVKVLTLDSSYGLPSIDKNYGNRGINYNKDWHGWNPLMISKARELSYKDWEKEYDISVSYVKTVKPLSQEEINYYLNKIAPYVSKNRYILIETALKSVGKIPYYYGGKTNKAGYDANNFGTKISGDYKGRCLKGLDCSGWVSWVYLTAFNKYIIKSEGTLKLATEGTRILRNQLLPGDLIIRPGIDSHVMMFLEWADNGKVKVIHENGSVNNVSIGVFEAYYPYYRRILNS